MERRAAQSGEGKVGLLIALFIVGIAIFLGVKIIPVRITAYEFRDVIREEARYGAVRHNDEAVAKRIMSKARELEIPLRADDLSVRRTTSEMIITAKYEESIDLKVTTYVYKFEAKERAPLF
jgi:hypothetical protein